MEEAIEFNIRLLEPQDRTGAFKCHKKFLPLKTFLRRDALQFQEHMVAQTYVVTGLTGTSEENSIWGYITLTCSEVDIRNGYEMEDCQEAHKYDSMPAVKIARLAVDRRYNGRGLGTTLVELALAITLDKVAPATGCRFLITDSKQESVDFYLKCGFTALDEAQFGVEGENPIMFIDLYSAKEES